MKKCRECGKMFDVLWPEIWRYRRGNGTNYTYFCSWGCLRAYDRETEGKDMDGKRGRPAKKPVVEVADKLPESEVIQVAPIQPAVTEVNLTEKIFGKEPLEIYALKSRMLADGQYCREREGMTLRGMSIGGSSIYMTEREWCAFSTEILVALKQLGVKADE